MAVKFEIVGIVEGIPVKRYSRSVTGKKLRESLGIPEQIYGRRNFRIKGKFRAIRKRNRLSFLQKAAARNTGLSPSPRRLLEMRRAFDRYKFKCFPMREDCQCYCCDCRATLRHHVIPLSRGGRNKTSNIVPLCSFCHGEIHPHLRRPQERALAKAA